MGFIPAATTAKVTLEFDFSGIPVVNVFHHRYTAPFNATVAEALRDYYAAWWDGHLAPSLTNQIAWEAIEIRDLSVQDGMVFNYSDFRRGGVINQPAAPNQVAMTTTWQTGLAGRSNRGRTFWCGLPASATLNENWNDTAVAAFQIISDDLFEGAESAGYAMVVASYRHNNAPRTTAQLTPIVSSRANKPIFTQRRRLT